MAKMIQKGGFLAQTTAPPTSALRYQPRPRLAIGPVDDPAEREAERVAEQVLRMPVHTLQRAPVSIRRCWQCARAKSAEELCPACAAKAGLVQRAATSARPEVTPEVEASIGAMRGGGQPLVRDGSVGNLKKLSLGR